MRPARPGACALEEVKRLPMVKPDRDNVHNKIILSRGTSH